MDDVLKQFILKVLAEGKDFILAQAPDVVQQYLHAEIMGATQRPRKAGR